MGSRLGNFLIKLVVAELAHELPAAQDLRHPVADAGLRRHGCAKRWDRASRSPPTGLDGGQLAALDAPDWPEDPEAAEQLRLPLSRLCARYLAREKRGGRPRDPVARFHLGNGARLERINWLGDLSAKGLGRIVRRCW